MKSSSFVTDTHSLIWYFADNSRLTKRALNTFEKTVIDGSIIIPTVVIAELMHITKKGRIGMSFTETIERIEQSENFEVAPLDMDILKTAAQIEYELEMHDRLILATALYFNVPLITKDPIIKRSGLCKIIW